MGEIRNLVVAKRRLKSFGFQVQYCGTGWVELRKGEHSFRISLAEMLQLARQTPQQVQSRGGSRVHKALVIGSMYVTLCGKTWKASDLLPRPASTMPCEVCQMTTPSSDQSNAPFANLAHPITKAGERLAEAIEDASRRLKAKAAQNDEAVAAQFPWQSVRDGAHWGEVVTFPNGIQGNYRNDGHDTWLEVDVRSAPVPLPEVLHDPVMNRQYRLEDITDGVATYRETTGTADWEAKVTAAFEPVLRALAQLRRDAENIGAVGPLPSSEDWKANPLAEGVSDEELWNQFVRTASYFYRELSWPNQPEKTADVPPYVRRFAQMVLRMDKRNFRTHPLSQVERANIVWFLRRWGAALPGEPTIGNTPWKQK